MTYKGIFDRTDGEMSYLIELREMLGVGPKFQYLLVSKMIPKCSKGSEKSVVPSILISLQFINFIV